MDLEALGALAAAGVAAVGIPTALLVGRWQMSAAMRAAEETGRAGIAQAEATYRAALDTVRAEASAAHVQWHRGVRREAYASFLLAANQTTEAANRLLADSDTGSVTETTASLKADLDQAKTAVRAAFAVITLEGPGTVADAAQRILTAVVETSRLLEEETLVNRAMSRLVNMHEETVRSFVPDPTQPDIDPAGSLAHDLLAALANLHLVSRGVGLDELMDSPSLDFEDAVQAVNRAFAAYPILTFSSEEHRALLDAQYRGYPRARDTYGDAERERLTAHEAFVAAARAALDAVVT